MKLHNECKYLISSFIIVACCLQQYCRGQSTTVRPYKFGFTIDEQQHRKEQRDERGIVMGEFGFITADGIYHVTVYATDEQGRFRILAMKSYPYESPPKTVEVMVRPKIPPMAATSRKPLTKHNFNTEACSGCFLSNGNNKPKGINGAEGKMTKKDIRPLSKTLPNSSSAANPKIPLNNPATGKSNEFNLIDFQTNKDAIKFNTAVPKFLVFEDFIALEHAITNHQFPTPPTHAPFNLAAIPFTNAPYEIVTTPYTHQSNNIYTSTFETVPYKVATTPSTLILNKVAATSSTNETHKKVRTQLTSDLNAYSEDEKRPTTSVHYNDPTTPSIILPNKIESLSSTNVLHEDARTQYSIDLNAFSQDEKRATTSVHYKDSTTPSTLIPNKVATTSSTNVPRNDFRTQLSSDLNVSTKDEKSLLTNAYNKDTVTPSTHLKMAPTKFYTNNNFNDQKTPLEEQQQNSNNYAQTHNAPHDKHPLSLTNNKDTPIITNKTQSIINSDLNFMKTKPFNFLKYDLSLPTNSAALENKLSKTPFTNSPERTDEQSSHDDSLLQESTNLSKQPSVLSTQNSRTELNTKPLHTQDTTNPADSKDLNQKTTKTVTQGSSDASTTSKTATGNVTPIMDIIMQKVLPALTGKTPKTLATTLNNKPNAVPSDRKTSSSNSGFDTNKRTGGGSIGPSGANDDGDLYRFKYILDYHGHTESGKRNGNKEGSYFAIGDDNVERTIEYVANEFGYQPRVRWRKLDANEIKSKENTLKDYEFVWFKQ